MKIPGSVESVDSVSCAKSARICGERCAGPGRLGVAGGRAGVGRASRARVADLLAAGLGEAGGVR